MPTSEVTAPVLTADQERAALAACEAALHAWTEYRGVAALRALALDTLPAALATVAAQREDKARLLDAIRSTAIGLRRLAAAAREHGGQQDAYADAASQVEHLVRDFAKDGGR